MKTGDFNIFSKTICVLCVLFCLGCSESNPSPEIKELPSAITKELPKTITFASELEKADHFHPVNWKRFSGSAQSLAESNLSEKNCRGLQDLFDMYDRAFINFKKATGKAPSDAMDWLDHAMYASDCYAGEYSPHSKE